MALGMVESDLETTPARSYDVPTMQLPSVTWQHVQQMPDDGNRYEAIEGDLYVTPAPTPRHQILLLRLYDALRPLLTRSRGVLLVAPVGSSSSRIPARVCSRTSCSCPANGAGSSGKRR